MKNDENSQEVVSALNVLEVLNKKEVIDEEEVISALNALKIIETQLNETVY